MMFSLKPLVSAALLLERIFSSCSAAASLALESSRPAQDFQIVWQLSLP
jgi:hypothetical protein